MNYSTLVSSATLEQNLDNPDWVVVDCRFSLADSQAGGTAYRHGHIANARYADLTKTCRQPSPAKQAVIRCRISGCWAKKLGNWGIGNNSQVVVYDDMGGAMAGRLWWLLRCLGHEKVAVLMAALNSGRNRALR